jgi:hypothetical protein
VAGLDEATQTPITLGEVGEGARQAAVLDGAAISVTIGVIPPRQAAVLMTQLVGAEVGFEARTQVEQAIEGAALGIGEGMVGTACPRTGLDRPPGHRRGQWPREEEHRRGRLMAARRPPRRGRRAPGRFAGRAAKRDIEHVGKGHGTHGS